MTDPFYKDLDIVFLMCPGWGVSQPPLGISCLSGFLKRRGFTAQCFDLSLELFRIIPEKKYWELNYPEFFTDPKLFSEKILPHMGGFVDMWVQKIIELNPGAVGFSLFMSNMNVSFLLARCLRERKSGIVLIGGGPEVTRIKRVIGDGMRGFVSLDRAAIMEGVFDLFIEGEGEETLSEVLPLIRKLEDARRVRGVVYAREGRFVVNEPRLLLPDLDILPPPDFGDFDLDAYTRRSLPLSTSRGCINRCTFCADSPLWKNYRCRSSRKVTEDILFLMGAYARDEFEMVDSLFNGDMKQLERLCDTLISIDLNIRWSAKVAVRKEMTVDLLKKMKAAGCVSLAYGVESGSPAILKDMRKNIDPALIAAVIKDSWGAGILVNCFFIIGYPTETESDFQMTLDFIRENAAFIYRFDQITGCHIEDDSYLGLHFDKYGIIFKEDGWHSAQSTPEIRHNRLSRFRELARKLHPHYHCEVQV
jgi:hypothetical protein